MFRIERTRLLASLVRMLGDIDRAEELIQDAFVAALADWPRGGIPDKPGAWLMATAKRRAIDAFRRDRLQAKKTHWTGPRRHAAATTRPGSPGSRHGRRHRGSPPRPDLRRLPSGAADGCADRPLLGGLTTDEIARAFLSREATITQCIVRAKRSLAEAMALYRRNGYREIPRYNDNPYAEHWFEKRLNS